MVGYVLSTQRRRRIAASCDDGTTGVGDCVTGLYVVYVIGDFGGRCVTDAANAHTYTRWVVNAICLCRGKTCGKDDWQ